MKKEKKYQQDPYRMRPIQMAGWSGRAISIAVNVIVLMQITFYCTNILAMSPVLVGTLLMASKIFDGVKDIFAGVLIDKTKTRWGKARPYEFSILFVWAATVLLFSCPDLGNLGKAVWVFAIYSFINCICVTLLNASEAVYLVRAFKYEDDRTKLLSVNGLLVMLFCTAAGMVFPILMGTLGTTKGGWTTMTLIMAIPMMLIGMGRFLLVKEKVDTTAGAAVKIGFKDFVPAMQNKYIWIFCGITLFVNLISNSVSSVGTYYFAYVVGDIKLLSIVNMLGLITPFLLLLMPKLLSKISLKQLFLYSFFIGIIGSIIRGIAGANIPLLVLGSLFQSLASMAPSYYTVLLLLDIMDYHEWKKGVRVEGVLSAINSFAGKLSGGIAAGGVGLLMGICGFDGTLAVQSSTAMGSIVALYCWIPAVLYAFLILFIRLFDLDKKMPKIREELEERRKAAVQ